MFDITSVAASETSVLELVSAADEPLLDADGKPLTITLYGPGTAQFARASQRRQNKLLDRLKKKGKADLSPDEQTAEQADFLASVTVSFNGWNYPPAGKATGADLFKAASLSDNDYYFTVTTQNGDKYYFAAQVMSSLVRAPLSKSWICLTRKSCC